MGDDIIELSDTSYVMLCKQCWDAITGRILRAIFANSIELRVKSELGKVTHGS